MKIGYLASASIRLEFLRRNDKISINSGRLAQDEIVPGNLTVTLTSVSLIWPVKQISPRKIRASNFKTEFSPGYQFVHWEILQIVRFTTLAC